MSFADLQSFIKQLDDMAELSRIKKTVDPYLETATVINQVCKSKGKNNALLFDKISGSHFPFVANLFGSKKRVAMSLGVKDVEVLANRLRDDLKTCDEKDDGRALAQIIRKSGTESFRVNAPPCFSVDVSEEGLNILPALHSWPGDGGRYLTLGQVFTRHPDSGQQNCGMYRVQILDKQTALIRCHPGSGGGAHLAAWHAQGLAIEVHIIEEPITDKYGYAGASLPGEVSELKFAGYLTGQPSSLAECQNSDLCVPSTAEFVIEGEIFPGEEQLEGPFGNHTGYYSPAISAPVLRVKSVHMRESAVYPCTVVGPPPMENMYLAQAAERLLLPLIQHQYPCIVDLHMPLEGVYHHAALVSVDNQEISMQEISNALRQTTLLRNSRLIVLLGSGNDLQDVAKVYWRIINADDWTRSVYIDGDKMTIDARSLPQRDPIHQA